MRKQCMPHTPETFDAPSQAELNTAKPGDFVKIGFSLPDDHPQKQVRFQCERMWVEITEVVRDAAGNAIAFKGELNNDPHAMYGLIKCGDAVEVEAKHCMDFLN